MNASTVCMCTYDLLCNKLAGCTRTRGPDIYVRSFEFHVMCQRPCNFPAYLNISEDRLRSAGRPPISRTESHILCRMPPQPRSLHPNGLHRRWSCDTGPDLVTRRSRNGSFQHMQQRQYTGIPLARTRQEPWIQTCIKVMRRLSGIPRWYRNIWRLLIDRRTTSEHQQHLNSATSIPPRGCTCPSLSCGGIFKRMDHLRRHTRTHAQEQPQNDLVDNSLSTSENSRKIAGRGRGRLFQDFKTSRQRCPSPEAGYLEAEVMRWSLKNCQC